jgi:hypothetical protein
MDKQAEIARIKAEYEARNKEIERQHRQEMAKIIGGGLLSIGSAFIPGTAGLKVAGALGKTIAPMVGKKIGTEIASGLVSGGLSGAVEGLGRGLIENKNPLKTMAQDSAVGLATGGLGGLAIGKIGQNIARKSLPNNPAAQKQYFDDYVEGLSKKGSEKLIDNSLYAKAMADLRAGSMGYNSAKNRESMPNFFVGTKAENINNLGEFDRAVALEQYENAKNPTLYKETGWFRGADGNWRYEIPSGKLNENINWQKTFDLNGNPMQYAKLSEVYENPLFYQAYPDAKNLDVNLSNLNDISGSYNSWGGEISLDELYNYKKTNQQVLNKLNELKQDPLYVKAHNFDKDVEAIRNDYLEYKNSDLRKQEEDLLNNLTMNGWNENALPTIEHELQHYIQDIEKFARGGSLKTAGSVENYHKLAGEVEARLAEKRIGLAEELLKKYKPFEKNKYGYDVAPTKQILSNEYGKEYGKGKVYKYKENKGQEQFAKDLADDTLKYRDEWVKIGNKDYRVLNLPKKDYGKILHILDTNLSKDIPIGEVLEKSDSNYLYKFQKVSPTDYKFIKRTKLK